ncbi:hypothetical protein Acsp06_40480 [Actinomycetospora sp. NBRC 106375]|uniref:hypothetical protein n=1 Tax=Actinomycetospora sp. NBRC 106375 TaxID=3032207 RepID=UPI0024A15184|nr:hypothetical protein [Actinomycetospora sp. NBRC 106375]GLZ47863.1 hypothetical protein Acsp06_40480 [Actinomycetospora sp. NBRC 106375]
MTRPAPYQASSLAVLDVLVLASSGHCELTVDIDKVTTEVVGARPSPGLGSGTASL